ncbi:pilus assembly protein PilP [Alishewanella jeotgali]|uniref:Type IV pilus biogenesis protein PilP n=1 Tax=Alishewanella jeotgali KCTC 22429 TaxID=1129374 RepID=H3ZCS1_9ALTE|nr:pilus assembly protein PilP [Alishewanella jeotgali]EHR41651.1 type IV pilus biogenesis protein PilP [Alishewanella jeotgali KCTC 22429]
MRALITVVAATLFLTGCFDDLSDIQQHMENVKSNSRPRVEPLPQAKEFIHIPYTVAGTRSPFSEPTPEAIQDRFLQQQDCMHPDPNRRKEPLERFALDNLRMRGTLGDGTQLWALVESADKALHRITLNNYMGLFHGKVIKVEPTHIDLLEMIPDGSGCWVERTTRVQMFDAATAGN